MCLKQPDLAAGPAARSRERLPAARSAAAGVLPHVVLLTCSLACRVGPDYAAPEMEVPERFEAPGNAAEDVAASTADTLSVDAWWETLADPVLTRCIEEAFTANPDVRASLERIRSARAMRHMESSKYWPEIDGRLGYTVDRLSANNPRFKQAVAAGVFPRDVEYWEAGFDVRWELDVFGGTERRVEAAVARIEEEEYRRGALMLSVAAEVARNYVEVRGNQLRLRIVEERIANEAERTALLEARQRAGLIDGDRVHSSRALRKQLESLRPALQAEVRAGQFRLAVLRGRPPEDTDPELAEPAPLPEALGQVPVGLPSELLLRRPDVLAAERKLAAATAEIGVARAEAFPRFYLTGSPYLQSADFSDLFSGASTGWVFGPSVSWNLFSAGRNKSLREAAEARTEQVLLEYEATVHLVLEEVESSLTRYGHDAESLKLLAEAQDARRARLEIESLRLDGGVADRLDVLDARAAWMDARLERLDREVLLLTRLVTLYKALGGGWAEAEAIVIDAGGTGELHE